MQNQGFLIDLYRERGNERYRSQDKPHRIQKPSASYKAFITAEELSIKRQLFEQTCNRAQKYQFLSKAIQFVERARTLPQLRSEEIRFPRNPIWIETPDSIVFKDQAVSALFFSCPEEEYNHWRITAETKSTAYLNIAEHLERGQWKLQMFDKHCSSLFSFSYLTDQQEWDFLSDHQCPFHACRTALRRYTSFGKTHSWMALIPCKDCREALNYWSTWLVAALFVVQERILTARDLFITPVPFVRKRQGQPHEEMIVINASPHRPEHSGEKRSTEHDGVLQRGEQPLLIEQCIEAIRQFTPQSPSLSHFRAKQTEVALERSQKYLWMESAWLMTEILCQTTDEALVLFPPEHLYIELEQPHTLYGNQVAAFSLIVLTDHDTVREAVQRLQVHGSISHSAQQDQERIQRWQFSVFNAEGKAIQTMFYEYDTATSQGVWTLPQGYACPEGRCKMEELTHAIVYTLCEVCQQKVTHCASWITVATRMIAGDFQEHVEMQEPDFALETATRTVQDPVTGETKKVRTLHHYRIIRYHDACIYKGTMPQTKRGSWMAGRPIAENEYEVNPHAIIYVQIQPRKHTRTYRHQRFLNMRGKKQHIDPKPRLQPMTIATFRRLRQIQRITRVSASKFDE